MAIVSGCSEHPGNSVKGRVLPPARSGSNRFVRRLERLCTRRATAVRATSTTAPAERYPGARNISATRDIARTSRAFRAVIPPSEDGIPGISRRRCAAPGLMAFPERNTHQSAILVDPASLELATSCLQGRRSP